MTQELSYETTPDAPRLDPAAPGLALEVKTTASPHGRTPVAACSFSLPAGPPGALHRGRVSATIEIVAVDTESGQVYHRSADRRPSTGETEHAPERGGAFTIDLVPYLKLPRVRANYAVFLWLNDLTSAPRTIEVDGDELEPAVASAFRWERSPRALERREVVVELSRADAAPSRIQGRIHAPTTGVLGKGPTIATVMALRERKHELAWRRQALPENLWQRGEVAFEVEPAKVFAGVPSEPGEREHFIVFAHGARSAVLTLEKRRG